MFDIDHDRSGAGPGATATGAAVRLNALMKEIILASGIAIGITAKRANRPVALAMHLE
jgi:hypothetical protein